MDEEHDSLPNHLFISLRHEFSATRVIGNRLSPTNIKLKLDISTLDDESQDYSVRMEVALAKMSYFVDNILQDSILVFSENAWAIDNFLCDNGPQTSNTVVLCPDEPTDGALCELLICKLRALSGGSFEFHSIEVKSTDARGMSFTFVGGSPGDSFPTSEIWLGEKNFFSRPWWNRDDASTLDVQLEEGDDIDAIPAWAYSLGFIAEQMAQNGRPRENVIVRPEFRPKIIDGGRKD